jgi:uncharacterized protein (UPF0212 family)
LLLKRVNGSETIWCYHPDFKKTSKEKMNGMQFLVSMKLIYKNEQEVSSKETSVTFNARNMNYSLNAKGVWYMSQRNCRTHDSCGNYFFKCNEMISNAMFFASLLSMKVFNVEAKDCEAKTPNKTYTQARNERFQMSECF